jgi:hypothetical protein
MALTAFSDDGPNAAPPTVLDFALGLVGLAVFFAIAASLLVLTWRGFQIASWRCPRCGRRFHGWGGGMPRKTCQECGVSLQELIDARV